jgi:hypothetical protein
VKKQKFLEREILKRYALFISFLTQSHSKRLLPTIVQAAGVLLTSHPHFNFRSELIQLLVSVAVKKNLPEAIHQPSIQAIENLYQVDFTDGSATLETVRRITVTSKNHNYQVNPLVMKTFLKLRLSEDIGTVNPFAPEKEEGSKDRQYEKKKKMQGGSKTRKKLKAERKIARELEKSNAQLSKQVIQKTVSDLYVIYMTQTTLTSSSNSKKRFCVPFLSPISAFSRKF